jgi:hypothetical protein
MVNVTNPSSTGAAGQVLEPWIDGVDQGQIASEALGRRAGHNQLPQPSPFWRECPEKA